MPPEHARQMKEGLALFKEHVRPALIRYCLDCHGGKETKGEFDLSGREPLIASGHVELGKAAESQLYLVITHEEEPHMPHKAPKLAERDHRADRALDRPGRALRQAARRAQRRRGGPHGGADRPRAKLLVVPAAGRRHAALGSRRGMGPDADRPLHPGQARGNAAWRRTRRPIAAC